MAGEHMADVELKPQVYKDPRPKEYFDPFHERARRGPAGWTYDEDAFQTAFKLLGDGNAVVMYCEGGRSRTGKLADEAKPGIGRLALQSGVPVVPIAILGSHKVRNWKRLQFPKVTIQYGEPFKF